MKWLGSYYIAVEKLPQKKSTQSLPLDDVARFHLRNGAEFHQINWMANTSQNGIMTSSTMMVNYLYDLSQVQSNAEKFGAKDAPITMSKTIESILSV